MSDDDLIRRGDVRKAVQYHVTDDDDRNTLSHAIRDIPPAKQEHVADSNARGVGVNPLVWLAKSEWHHVAENPFGECWIKHYNGRGGLWTLYGPGHYGPNNNFPTLDAAKAAAQADYEARILAALATTDAAQESKDEQ